MLGWRHRGQAFGGNRPGNQPEQDALAIFTTVGDLQRECAEDACDGGGIGTTDQVVGEELVCRLGITRRKQPLQLAGSAVAAGGGGQVTVPNLEFSPSDDCFAWQTCFGADVCGAFVEAVEETHPQQGTFFARNVRPQVHEQSEQGERNAGIPGLRDGCRHQLRC